MVYLLLETESTTPTTPTIVGTDLSCLPVTNLNLQDFLISTTLFYFTTQKLTINSKSIISITQVLAPYEDFSIISGKLNGALKMSYFINQESLFVSNPNSTSGYTLVNDALDTDKAKLRTVGFFGLLSVPDLTSYSSLQYTQYDFSEALVVSSLNIANIKTIEATITFPTSYHNNTLFFTINAKLAKPTAAIDLTKLVNCRSFQIVNLDKLFNLNGEYPIKTSPTTSIYYSGGNITKIPIGIKRINKNNSSSSATTTQS
ncbi:hypothetical protein ACTA71_007056 [Dictyostelium dimigraforme]